MIRIRRDTKPSLATATGGFRVPGQVLIWTFENDKLTLVFIGVKDNGECAHLPVTDQLLLNLAAMRSDGNILPFPSITVQKRTLNWCEMAVVVVEPSDAPPVRYNGRCWIRVGPRRGTATAAEEARKPMFFLKAADGALGGHATAAQEAYGDYRILATKIAGKTGLALPDVLA